MSIDVKRWRTLFPFCGEVVYLNHASECPLPQTTVEALHDAAQRKAEPFRMSLEDYLGIPRRCREKFAKLIGAQSDEIAFTSSTTYGVNVIAAALVERIREGDEVVLWRGEFPSGVYPWLNQERNGLKVRMVGAPLKYPSYEAVLESLTESTRVLSLSWVSFTTGYRIDLQKIGDLCKERGIFFLVDATQGVGCLDLDVSDLSVDALVVSGHKWLMSPTGTGFLYVRKEHLETLPAPFAGWYPFLKKEGFDALTDYDLDWPERAERYEVGTPPNVLQAAMEASLDLLLETGVPAIESRLRQLNQVFLDRLSERWQIVSPVGIEEPHASAILSARMDGVDSWAGAKAIKKAGGYAVVREGCLRVSPHVYIEEEEMRRMAQALDAL